MVQWSTTGVSYASNPGFESQSRHRYTVGPFPRPDVGTACVIPPRRQQAQVTAAKQAGEFRNTTEPGVAKGKQEIPGTVIDHLIPRPGYAPMAKLANAPALEAVGWGFESLSGYHITVGWVQFCGRLSSPRGPTVMYVGVA